MYFRKTRPSTTCLYSLGSWLRRSASAASHRRGSSDFGWAVFLAARAMRHRVGAPLSEPTLTAQRPFRRRDEGSTKKGADCLPRFMAPLGRGDQGSRLKQGAEFV